MTRVISFSPFLLTPLPLSPLPRSPFPPFPLSRSPLPPTLLLFPLTASFLPPFPFPPFPFFLHPFPISPFPSYPSLPRSPVPPSAFPFRPNSSLINRAIAYNQATHFCFCLYWNCLGCYVQRSRFPEAAGVGYQVWLSCTIQRR